MILPDSEELDEVEINHLDLVEVDLEEQDFIDEVNLFDYVSLGFAALCLYLNLNSYFSTLEIRFTTLSQEFHYTILIFFFETTLLTFVFLLKPFETIKFVNITTFYLPSVLFGYYLIRYFGIYQFTLLEGLVFMPWRIFGYMILWLIYIFLKGYVVNGVRKFDKEQKQKKIEDRKQRYQK